MNVGIIGAGHIGGTLARLLVNAGYGVMLANSRGPETLQGLVQELGPRAQAGSVEEAARFGEIVIISIPLKAYASLAEGAFAGKIVVDTMNYYPDRDGHFSELDSDQTTSSELLQKKLSRAKVVKAFNSIRWDVLAKEGRPRGERGRLAIPLSGDDIDSKRRIQKLMDDIGFDSVDAGSLEMGGRRHQVGSMVYASPLTELELSQRLSI